MSVITVWYESKSLYFCLVLSFCVSVSLSFVSLPFQSNFIVSYSGLSLLFFLHSVCERKVLVNVTTSEAASA